MLKMTILGHIFAVLSLVPSCTGVCQDIDTKACELMQHQNPGLCKDPNLSFSACPRFCKLCPLVCHHCEASVLNFTDCSTTKTCQVGEQCMLHQLTSSRDGHHEYRMNCASLEMCDGTGLMPFGRRDIITHCCSEDMCNFPTIPTSTPTPVCNRDIEILIQDSRDPSASQYSIQFVKDLASHLVIGPANNLIGVAILESSVRRRFHLDSHQSLPEVLQALDGLSFNHDTSTVSVTDVIYFLTKELDPQKNHIGRGSFKNSVIIIADHAASPKTNHHHNSDKGHAELSSVTVINVGGASPTDLSQMATDANHVFNIGDYASLNNVLPQVLQLLCS